MLLLCVIVQRGGLGGRGFSSHTLQFAEMLPSSPRPHPTCWQILQAACRLGGSLLTSHSAFTGQGRFIALCFITSQASLLILTPQSLLDTMARGILLKVQPLFCSKSCHGSPFPSVGKPESSQRPVGACVRGSPSPPGPPLPALVPSPRPAPKPAASLPSSHISSSLPSPALCTVCSPCLRGLSPGFHMACPTPLYSVGPTLSISFTIEIPSLFRPIYLRLSNCSLFPWYFSASNPLEILFIIMY